MAGNQELSQDLSFGSTETSICIIPPRHLWESIDSLRALYDKAYEKWPPHVNLIYPFVPKRKLEQAWELLSPAVESWSRENRESGSRLSVTLDSADAFVHKHSNTLYRYDSSHERRSALTSLRRTLLRSMRQDARASSFTAHLTIGQTEDAGSNTHRFLLDKVRMLPPATWDVEELCILTREGSAGMRLWGVIDLRSGALSRKDPIQSFYAPLSRTIASSESDHGSEDASPAEHVSRPTYHLQGAEWLPLEAGSNDAGEEIPETVSIASYNVLADFHYPPSLERLSVIVDNVLSESGISDILVFQEVSDSFLSGFLADPRVKDTFKYASHGPPGENGVDPLPSLLNIVLLSRWPFTWEWLSSKRRHKGSLIARFFEGSGPVIVAGVHLTCGLTDGAVAAKKTELGKLLNHLKTTYPDCACVLAGDFNITTSAQTIDHAIAKKNISLHSAENLARMDRAMAEMGFVDAWTASRVEDWGSAADADEDCRAIGDENVAYEGEQGATFDPSVNPLAAESVGSGTNNRPQRYDRILVRGKGILRMSGFNLFGLPGRNNEKADEESTKYGSDHWAVRCTMSTVGAGKPGTIVTAPEGDASLAVPVQPRVMASDSAMADAGALRESLASLRAFPSAAEAATREAALELVRGIFSANQRQQQQQQQQVDSSASASVAASLSFDVIAVGSHGLGVSSPSSDIDCFVIGGTSSRNFFALATQLLRRAAVTGAGVRILRRVNANTGTMLELEVLGVRMDLQYCHSGTLLHRWREAMNTGPSHPAFQVSPQTLLKLKPLRDMYYLRRSVPDLASFRTAHLAIKCWAKHRGIYSARFGYLGGIHISVMLAVVCKQLAHDSGLVTVPDVLATFFDYYAQFDWTNKMVFDPFFHKSRLQYSRTAREPMVILGYHGPALNVAHTASVPSTRTITEEFRKASAALADPSMTWSRFLAGSDGAQDFLRAYKSYVRIDVLFWGLSLAKGSSFVGWLESRCVMLLVDINRRLPQFHVRIWPARFVDRASSSASGPDERDYQGCYLIGLDILKDGPDNNGQTSPQEMSREQRQAALGSLQTVLRRFEEQIRGDEKYFDARSSWMAASVVRQAELGDDLVLDTREWGEHTIGEDDFGDDDLDEEAADEDEILEEDGVGMRAASTSTAALRPRVAKPAGATRLRTAADVINRLRWDPALDESDYIVGYEDRFLGAKEKPLESWKSDQTDEEFIPQHRILYFKRASDGEVVWERRTRIDKVFGSGGVDY